MTDYYSNLTEMVKNAVDDPDPSISHWRMLLEEQNKLITKLRNMINIERAIHKDALETVEEAIDALAEIKGVRR